MTPSDAELLTFASEEQFFLFASQDEVLDIMKTTLQKYCSEQQTNYMALVAQLERERDELRLLNRALIGNRMNAAEEHADLIELLEQATSYTCCSAYSPSLTREINAALAKIGEKL